MKIITEKKLDTFYRSWRISSLLCVLRNYASLESRIWKGLFQISWNLLMQLSECREDVTVWWILRVSDHFLSKDLRNSTRICLSIMVLVFYRHKDQQIQSACVSRICIKSETKLKPSGIMQQRDWKTQCFPTSKSLGDCKPLAYGQGAGQGNFLWILPIIYPNPDCNKTFLNKSLGHLFSGQLEREAGISSYGGISMREKRTLASYFILGIEVPQQSSFYVWFCCKLGLGIPNLSGLLYSKNMMASNF